MIPLAAARPVRNRPTASRWSCVRADWSRLPRPPSVGGRRHEDSLERLEPADFGRTQQKLALDEAGDLVDFPVVDGAVGCGDVDSRARASMMRRGTASRRRPAGFFLTAQGARPVVPGVGPAVRRASGSITRPTNSRGLRQRLTLLVGEPGSLGNAVKRGQVRRLRRARSHPRESVRRRFDPTFPGRDVSTVAFNSSGRAWNASRLKRPFPSPQHAAQGLELSDAARPDGNERGKLARDSQHVRNADRLIASCPAVRHRQAATDLPARNRAAGCGCATLRTSPSPIVRDSVIQRGY